MVILVFINEENILPLRLERLVYINGLYQGHIHEYDVRFQQK